MSKKIALIGGGPAALFMYKRIVEAGLDAAVTIYEKHEKLGAGMPYSHHGAAAEHITNVSDNEIPDIKEHVSDWVAHAPKDLLQSFGISPATFNEYKVLPRLLFGDYLAAQFEMLRSDAKKLGIETDIRTETLVIDLAYARQAQHVAVTLADGTKKNFDHVIICTGHTWPKDLETQNKNWFDSPYPPQKISKQINYPVAIRGASLTAIDAVRTLAQANGHFSKNEDGTYAYQLREQSQGFKIVLHSIGGLLPAMRFHLSDTQLTPAHLLSEEEVYQLKEKHNGFVPLDLVYQLNFLNPLEKQQPYLYHQLQDTSIEGFIDFMMRKRKQQDAFELLRAEYWEAEDSIEREQSVLWKENLAALSYAMNYPAKHFSAEDMMRLRKTMMPLISVIIAFVPQDSAREMMAMHDAGVLDIVAVGQDSEVLPQKEGGCIYKYSDASGTKMVKSFKMFIDAIGQRPLMFNDIPFEGLKNPEAISAAYLRFGSVDAGKKEMEAGNKLVKENSNGDYYLQVPGINVNDHFQVLDIYGVASSRLYIMAVPYIEGINPDYSGLDFCEAASEKIIQLLKA